jgi:DNA-directed RNA polymerase subunit L
VELITPQSTINYHESRKGGQGPVWAVAPLIIIMIGSLATEGLAADYAAKSEHREEDKEWANNEHYGKNRSQQLSSLQKKKMFEHKERAGHKAALKLLAEAEKETLPNVLVKTLAREKEITSKIFRTAYKVAEENQSFHNFEAEIYLQERSGIDKRRILHSANACSNIVNHISTEMRKTSVNEIIRSKSKISIIIDESMTFSKKSTLIIYVRLCLSNCGMDYPFNLKKRR